MQGLTHLATGILIQKAIEKVKPHYPPHLIVAFLAILSHGILDKLARFTYHPPTPLPGDWFWISYHLIIAFLTIFVFVKYWKKYKLALIFSVLPDFDWVVLHSSNFFSVQIPFWKEPIIHRSFFSFLDLLPPFSFLNSLPNWNLDWKGVIIEFTSLAILTTLIYAIGKEKAEEPALTVQDEILTCNWIDKVLIYQTCMDHEQTIRTSYQNLLTTLEVAIFGLVFTLFQLKLTSHLWLLFAVGIFLCIFFGIPSEYRARNVDYWRVKIIKLVSGTDLEDAFKGGKYRWIPFGKAGFLGEYLWGHWFERIIVSSMLIIWQITLWLFPSPFIIRLCGMLATCLWIIYAFRVIELKGKIIIS